jgi:hypothetical protein
MNVRCSKQSDTMSLVDNSSYHPSDLTHGLLAYHCSIKHSEESVPGELVLAKRARMSVLRNDKHLDANNHSDAKRRQSDEFAKLLTGWLVQHVHYDERTEYLGILYVHHERRQAVLVHRCTVLDSLLARFGRISTGAQDIQGIILNEITKYQEWGYRATRHAVASVRRHGANAHYALSFSGFSLGAWMAELSVYYCHQDEINWRGVRAVTFDGPGSHFMLEHGLERNKVLGAHGSSATFRPTDLDIVAYLALPNLVNCTNQHVGLVYVVDDEADFPTVQACYIPSLCRYVCPKNFDSFF